MTDRSLIITLRNILDNCFDTSTSVLYTELLKIITIFSIKECMCMCVCACVCVCVCEASPLPYRRIMFFLAMYCVFFSFQTISDEPCQFVLYLRLPPPPPPPPPPILCTVLCCLGRGICLPGVFYRHTSL